MVLKKVLSAGRLGTESIRTLVRMARYPGGTPYAGPTANYDEQIESEQLVRRLVYGRPRPLLGHMDRRTDAFFGRLIDGLSNAHAVLVKVCAAQSTARGTAVALRKELPSDLFSVGVRYNAEEEDWEVIAYNRIHRELRRRAVRVTEGGPVWVTMKEAARVLQISHPRACALVHEHGLRHKRTGGRNEILIRQQDLAVLANRPGRWKKRKKT